MVPTPVRRRPTLRRLTPGDRGAFLDAVPRSRALHHPWAYPPDTPDAFDAYVKVHPARRVLAVVVDHEAPSSASTPSRRSITGRSGTPTSATTRSCRTPATATCARRWP